MKSMRDLLSKLPNDGEMRDRLRMFNLSPRANNKAASVKELAEALGVDVRQVSMRPRFAGRLVQDPFSDSGFAIEVNDKHDVRVRRFTVLHELGHLLLGHVDRNDPLAEPLHLNRGEEEFYFDTRSETEANDFADVLLFGDGAIEAAFTLHRGNIEQIAHYFGVTENMVRVALRKFNSNLR